jgi:hypothetical protein
MVRIALSGCGYGADLAGEGFASIAGGQGTMWATALQMGELVDTASRVSYYRRVFPDSRLTM